VRTSSDYSFLRGPCESWLDCLSRYHKTLKVNDGIDDWPFWYGERPLVGFLAAGIWDSRGACIEEYQADKKPDVAERKEESYLGRGDLYFRLGSNHEGNIEFKMHNIGISQTHHFNEFLDRNWKISKKDAKSGRQRGIPSFGGMFLRPYVGEGPDIKLYTKHLRQFLTESWDTLKPDALAWWCPMKKVLDTKEDTNDWVVGVIMLIKRVK
jgi:hypothetical protein